MSGARTYLDWNATAPLRPEARDAMMAALDLVGNPSSVHAEGRAARAVIEDAREDVAALLGADPADVIFTSGATEANAAVLAQPWQTIVLSDAEHDSVRMTADRSAATIEKLAVSADGVVAIEAAARDVLKSGARPGECLVVLQAANNETGVVQPVAELSAFAREHGLFMLCDAVQVAGRLPVTARELGAHYITVSAHKLGGPKGIGALVLDPSAPFAPLISGGGQERRRRAGTESIAAIAGFGAAARAAIADMATAAMTCRRLRERLEEGIADITPDAVIIGRNAPRLPNTTCVALPGRQADVLVIALDLAGFAVSAGAACSSGKVTTSATLGAMGVPDELTRAAIRISLGPTTTDDEIAAFLAAWKSIGSARRKAA